MHRSCITGNSTNTPPPPPSLGPPSQEQKGSIELFSKPEDILHPGDLPQ